MYWSSDRDKRKEFDGVVAERKAKEKNEAWIRELEARDEENKEIAARKVAEREMRNRGVGMAKCVLERSEEKRPGVLSAVERLLGK